MPKPPSLALKPQPAYPKRVALHSFKLCCDLCPSPLRTAIFIREHDIFVEAMALRLIYGSTMVQLR